MPVTSFNKSLRADFVPLIKKGGWTKLTARKFGRIRDRLFDLEVDPREMRSVYDDSAYAQQRGEMEAELRRLRGELGVVSD